MKNFHKIILALFTLIFALSISTANAQSEQFVKKTTAFSQYFYINGNLGFTNAWDDVSAKRDLFSDPMFGGGLNLGYQFSPIFGSRLNLTTGFTDVDNINYDSQFADFSAQLTIDLTNILYKDNNDKFNLYAFGGVGFGGVGFWKRLVGDSSGDRTNNNIIFPGGIGGKYALADNVDITLESGLHYSVTDQLDGLSASDKIYTQDGFLFTSIGLTYKLGASGISKMIKNSGSVKYKITPAVLHEKGGKVPYEVSVTFFPNYFSRNAAINVAPVLKYGDQKLPLASQIFIGEKVSGKGQMVPFQTGGTYTFSGEFDFIPEMASSTVVVNPVVYIPKTGMDNAYKNLFAAQFKIGDGVIHTEDFAGGNEEILLAESGYELETIIRESAKLFFPKNLYSYNNRFGLNKTEQASAAISALNNFLAQGLEIKNITVNAYASPEGEETFNANLSDNRAKVGDKYIHSELKKIIKDCSDVTFKVKGNGADWDGFMSALESSNIEEKSTILNVVKSAAPAKKEEEIRNMILIYPVLEDLLSYLRRAEIAVNSFENKRTSEEIAVLATTNPNELTLQELLYAATLTDNKEAQGGIYKTAANLYSASWEAQANFAYSEIQKGNLSNALTYLEKADKLAPNNATILNNMGVVHAKQPEWGKAKKYFTNAQKLGANENYNLGIVAIQLGEYTKAIELFGSKKCDVNVGLAQLMTEKYEAAKANLSCAEETCKTNYLLAIVGARTANDAEVFAGLKKAIEINPKIKGKAINDREFIRYFDNDAFISIVK
ncbi:MAG: hypothetical protein PF484_02220 [Bacteroidales bacterium]|jgi:opacity protein-like surface antigen/outer membrane protein OmpA-like peptidoglycan-associated protein|nr:hypothetical protein [Bacteroidales bacterium]